MTGVSPLFYFNSLHSFKNEILMNEFLLQFFSLEIKIIEIFFFN